jgi:alpha-glucosidase (family GH31 glycosyl hydrolase)
MGSVTLKKRDLARYSKVYPYSRQEPRYVYFANESFALESTTVDFNGGDQATYAFANSYSSVPVVVATSLDDSFNVFVSAISTTQVTVKASMANNSSASIVVVSQ